MTTEYFRQLAGYNEWANKRIYEACAALPEDAYYASRPAFFDSIHGTLNHILLGDRIWLDRLTGVATGPIALDAILCETRDALSAARAAEDTRIAAVVESVDDDRLDEKLAYRTSRDEPFTTPIRFVLANLFNHQTHHRGQVHGMLSQTTVAPPPLDLIVYMRQN